MKDVFASVQLTLRSSSRETGKLLNGRLLSTNYDRNALTSIIMHTYSPNIDLKLDDLVRRDLLLALMRVEGNCGWMLLLSSISRREARRILLALEKRFKEAKSFLEISSMELTGVASMGKLSW